MPQTLYAVCMSATFPIASILRRALVPAVVLGAFALARRWMPVSSHDEEKALPADTSVPSVVLVNICMLAIGFILLMGLHLFLITGNRFFVSLDGPGNMTIYPSSAIWWFLPGFASVCLAWEITYDIWRHWRPKQAEAYRAFTNVKSGFDSTRVLRLMGIFIVIPIGIASLLALPIHTTLTNDAIFDGHFARMRPLTYPFSETTDMTEFKGYLDRDGNFVQRAGIILRFKDGRSWNSANTNDPKANVDPQLRSYLVNRVNAPLRDVDLEPK